MTTIKINHIFGCISDFKESLRNWAIADRFEYRWSFGDTQRTKAVCVYKECPFAIRCNWYGAKSFAKITVLVSKHSCIGNSTPPQFQASRLDWLLGAPLSLCELMQLRLLLLLLTISAYITDIVFYNAKAQRL